MPLFEISLPKSISAALRLAENTPARQQRRVLKKLLKKALFTQFGQQYKFGEILNSRHPEKLFKQNIPTHDYDSIYENWWKRTLEGTPDVCWPGKIKYYALSSGTSGAASKYIPITNELMKGNRIVMIKQLLSLRNYENIPWRSVGKGYLMLGGSTDLQRGPGYYAGDLSGITAKKSPFWFSPFYKPGKRIAKTRDWNKKLEAIVEEAPNWDIGFVVGVPAWIQMCMEMIIERYQLKDIHELWPNLAFFCHGGVAFEPYRKGFERLLGKPLTYIETYLASEGFIAFQDRQFPDGMKLVLNEHIFFEFVPFDETNFNNEGELIQHPKTLLINEVEEDKDYAILMSTSAGAWRYLIGDTIKFVNKERSEIIITGRTKHFLSLVGEHLSVDNMNRAIQMASEKFNASIAEFTVAGVPLNGFFGHKWYIGSDDSIDATALKHFIDQSLMELNDDYAVERKSALKDITVDVLPEKIFMEFMAKKGKVGGQHKFPRVLKGSLLEEWNEFIKMNT
ncbi:MAG: GH3 auxin-responsive promoter family protein [Chitinophagaceae bacterium]|jgi:hypothetical protein